MTLYLKYRPQTIEELDLDHVRENLGKIVASKNIPHAFLFSGPKGAGKTSAARILAKVINCENPKKNGEPCNKCKTCLAIGKGSSMDVIEMDAASNRGIDDIRSLRENVMLAPSSSKKKIYIIDEAHMLTTEAANAFLKTLEEPPSHVIFILATTDPQKLPDTILSRLSRVNFSKASAKEIKRQLERAIKGEKLKVEDGVVDLIIKESGGSFREAIKILEGLSLAGNKIILNDAKKYISNNTTFDPEGLLNIINSKNRKEIIHEIEKYSSDGLNAKYIIDQLVDLIHKKIIEDAEIGEMGNLVNSLMDARSKLGNSPIDQLPLEIELIEWCQDSVKGESSKKKVVKPEKIEEVELTDKAIPVSTEKMESINADTWLKILNFARGENASIEALLRACEPIAYDGSHLNLGVFYRFHKERLESTRNLQMVEQIIAKVCGGPIKVSCELTERKMDLPKRSVEKPLTESGEEDIIQAAKEIFGN